MQSGAVSKVKSSVETLSPTRAKFTITVSQEDLKPSIKHAYEHIAEQVSIPGFRKGKVPAPIIDQRVGRPAVLDHAVNEGLDNFYRKAAEEHGIVPMGRPEANVITLPSETDFTGDLVVSVEVDVRPEVKLPDFSKISVEVEAAEATAEELLAEMDSLRERFGTLVTVDRPAKKGDYVTLDLVATIGGKEIDAANNISYELGSGELIEGIDEALDTLTAGENTTFESTLLGGDHEGEKAQISVTVISVKERELPVADDDFAQVAGGVDTLAELKETLKSEVISRKGQQQSREARTKLLEKLVADLKIPVPQGIVDAEVNRHLESEGRLDDDKHRAEVIEETNAMFAQQMILDVLAESKKITVGQGDLTQAIVNGAMQYGMDPNEFAQILTQNGQIQALVGDVARNKAVAYALGQIKVVDSKGKAVDMTPFSFDPEKDQGPAVDLGGDDHDHDHDHSHDADEKKSAPKKAAKKK
jgi:trigger factor